MKNENEVKFTPGPWHVAAVNLRAMDEHTALAVWDETHGQPDDSIMGRPVCMLTPIEKLNPTDEANARLISAAPELYEACKQVAYEIDKGANREVLRDVLLAALAKANGKDGEGKG